MKKLLISFNETFLGISADEVEDNLSAIRSGLIFQEIIGKTDPRWIGFMLSPAITWGSLVYYFESHKDQLESFCQIFIDIVK